MRKKYGIWGLGVVGKSVLTYLAKQGHQLSVMDSRIPDASEMNFLEEIDARYVSQNECDEFFSSQDVIIPSPGIDITPALTYRHKFIEELDLFCSAWKKPLITITGTLGKTSVTHFLSQILTANGTHVATGGNIGTAMLDVIEQQNAVQYALLELSSFQLERARCAPDFAIWTNFYPNHLDRHGSLENYFRAKFRMLEFQRDDQKTLLPLHLLQSELGSYIKNLQRPLHFFSTADPQFSPEARDTLYYIKNDRLLKLHNKQVDEICALTSLKTTADIPLENLVILLAACDILGILNQRTFIFPECAVPEHRLEKVGTARGITFYNDSKSSIPEATLSAVDRLQPARIDLMLGGVSKGVDRTNSIHLLKGKVSSVICFGAEAPELFYACKKEGIETTHHRTLEEAFEMAVEKADDNTTLLFSPSGASFDLFKNYKERGERFKALTKEFIKKGGR